MYPAVTNGRYISLKILPVVVDGGNLIRMTHVINIPPRGQRLHAYNEIMLISGAETSVKAAFGVWDCMLITSMLITRAAICSFMSYVLRHCLMYVFL